MPRGDSANALGGAITIALCGHWDHTPPCPLAPHYVERQPQFPVDATNPLYTPEGLYPNSGVNSLELDTSLTAACSNASTCRS